MGGWYAGCLTSRSLRAAGDFGAQLHSALCSGALPALINVNVPGMRIWARDEHGPWHGCDEEAISALAAARPALMVWGH